MGSVVFLPQQVFFSVSMQQVFCVLELQRIPAFCICACGTFTGPHVGKACSCALRKKCQTFEFECCYSPQEVRKACLKCQMQRARCTLCVLTRVFARYRKKKYAATEILFVLKRKQGCAGFKETSDTLMHMEAALLVDCDMT